MEYESAEQAEAVLIEMDRTLVGGQEVRLSLCTPGTSGRSTLAALIAAQGMVSTMPKERHEPSDSHGMKKSSVYRLADPFEFFVSYWSGSEGAEVDQRRLLVKVTVQIQS